MRPAEFVDPYSVAHALRAKGSILPLSFRDAAGFETPQAHSDFALWTTLSYTAARTILNDHENFSSRAYAVDHDRKMGAPTILSMDEPEHKAHRNLISAGFFARSVRHAAEQTVSRVVEGLLDTIEQRGADIDLVRDFTNVLPIQVIVDMVGVPDSDWPQFLRWIDDLVAISDAPEPAMQAGAAVQRYLADLVAERRRQPLGDLTSTLVTAEIDGERLSDPAIVAFLALLLTAGGETTVRAIGTTLVGLLSSPDQYAAVVADRKLIPRALDEGLRWDTPVQMIRRVASRDTQVDETLIPAGTMLLVHLGAANRDPARWEDPDRFDIFRPQRSHISFGYGPHFCLGLNLARFEAETALNRIMDRLGNLRLSGRAPVIRGLDLRGPDSLEVVFDRQSVAA